MDINTVAFIITAIATAIAAIVAIVAIIVQDRRSSYSQGVQVLLNLTNQFNNDAMKKKRKRFAKTILNNRKKNSNYGFLLGEILDHFQLVGILVKNKVLDLELVHSEYFFWIFHYYHYSSTHIRQFRQNTSDPSAWEDVENLYEKMVNIERKYRLLVEPSKASILDFLKSEASL